MSSDNGLYGIRKPKITTKEISSSTSLAFTSTLSTLLSANGSEPKITKGRPRRPTTKSDIFTSHNKNAKKRAAHDLVADDEHKQFSHGGTEGVDSSVLHRSKRKMEEKARIYSAMKRGEHVAGENDPESLIDFDRKWADNEAQGRRKDAVTPSDDGLESDDGQGEVMDYEDEFGRARRGTRADAEKMERRKLNKLLGAEELDRMSARPAMPSQIIYGDTVQSAAFNPEEPIVAQMEEIARKRDRSMTPPEAKHYEADKEVRSKGVGFYSFSKDEATRGREMEALERERIETERVREEREERKEKRRKEIEDRRKAIGEKRAKRQAEAFLDGLTAKLALPEKP